LTLNIDPKYVVLLPDVLLNWVFMAHTYLCGPNLRMWCHSLILPGLSEFNNPLCFPRFCSDFDLINPAILGGVKLFCRFQHKDYEYNTYRQV